MRKEANVWKIPRVEEKGGKKGRVEERKERKSSLKRRRRRRRGKRNAKRNRKENDGKQIGIYGSGNRRTLLCVVR